ncbi:MAG: sugar ABC transporter permease, partial [Actinobacteria bacterium]|nr:sugar ABC transporter permease [Actinomycetota bacterium]
MPAAQPRTLEQPTVEVAFLQRTRRWLEREQTLGWLLMVPGAVILLAFIAYPFFLGIWLSLTNSAIGVMGHFIGLSNFTNLLQDSIFLQTVQNTFVYSFVSVPFKLVLGLALALLMNQRFPFRNALRAGLLLPWIVPTALSSLAWLMIFDGVFSPISWLARAWGLTDQNINFLGTPVLAMSSLVIANIWRGIPFFAVSILAGLQAVPQELHEAAAIDGASPWQRFWAVTVPVIRGVTMIATLFSIIWTFADFQLIYVLTKGGPANSTHVFGTYAYQIGLNATEIGQGAAIALYMFPFLAIFAAVLLIYLR